MALVPRSKESSTRSPPTPRLTILSAVLPPNIWRALKPTAGPRAPSVITAGYLRIWPRLWHDGPPAPSAIARGLHETTNFLNSEIFAWSACAVCNQALGTRCRPSLRRFHKEKYNIKSRHCPLLSSFRDSRIGSMRHAIPCPPPGSSLPSATRLCVVSVRAAKSIQKGETTAEAHAQRAFVCRRSRLIRCPVYDHSRDSF